METVDNLLSLVSGIFGFFLLISVGTDASVTGDLALQRLAMGLLFMIQSSMLRSEAMFHQLRRESSK